MIFKSNVCLPFNLNSKWKIIQINFNFEKKKYRNSNWKDNKANIKTNELEILAMNYNPQHKIYSNRERYELHLGKSSSFQTALDSKVIFICYFYFVLILNSNLNRIQIKLYFKKTNKQ